MNRVTAFILLLLLMGWVLWQSGVEPVGQQMMPAWPEIQIENIASITLTLPGKHTTQLQKKEGKWFVVQNSETVPADQTAVERLLDDFAEMEPVRIVTRSADKHAALAIGDQQGTVVTLQDSNKTINISFVVGKQGSDLLSTYVRLAGDVEVVAMSRALVWQVKRTEASWIAVTPVEKPEVATKKNR